MRLNVTSEQSQKVLKDMVFNTISVGSAVTPTVIETYFSHVSAEMRSRIYLNWFAKLTVSVPQSQASSPKAYSSHLIP